MQEDNAMWFIKAIFTWWNDKTIGTAWYTFKYGTPVGTDDQGNKYYCERKGTRRWVIYNGYPDSSRVPPEWHRWLHYTSDTPPSGDSSPAHSWEKDHKPNQTGTAGAFFPPGSLMDGGSGAGESGNYEAWRPE